MRWYTLFLALSLIFCGLQVSAQPRGMDIYFIDTEGGAATLIVTPQGESLLIDSGNPGTRDAGRIAHVAKDIAHLAAIDALITTHWHLDHYGGVEELVKLLPIKKFYDHGIPEKSIDDPDNFPKLIAAYKAACQDKSITLNPGDNVPLQQSAGVLTSSLRCICARGEVLPDKPNSGKNLLAKGIEPLPADPSDNANSLGFVLTYGYFHFLDLGDLTWNIEYKLVWPTDKIGLIDLYQSTHHGLDISNNPAVIRTVRPIVAIYNNGPHKGGSPKLTATLRATSSLQAIYQMHRNLDAKPEENTAPGMIANRDDPCQGEFIHVAVAPDSKSYTVAIGQNGKPSRYETRHPDSNAGVTKP